MYPVIASIVAVFLLASQLVAAPSPPVPALLDAEVRECLETLAAAYAAPGAYMFTIKRGVLRSPELPSDVVDTIRRMGNHGVSSDGSAVLYLAREVYTVAPDGRVRVEELVLNRGGDPDRSTKVFIWSKDIRVEGMLARTDRCTVDVYPRIPIHKHMEMIAQGRTPHTRMFADIEYGAACRYILEAFQSDPALRVNPLGDRWIVRSESTGLEAEIMHTTGEIAQYKFVDTVRSATETRVKEWHPQAVFPARYPKVISTTTTMRSGTLTGEMVIDDFVVATAAPPETLFAWQSLAERAYDSRGIPLGDAREDPNFGVGPIMLPPLAVVDSETRSLKIAPRTNPFRVLIFSLGGGTILVAGLLWLKRRFR